VFYFTAEEKSKYKESHRGMKMGHKIFLGSDFVIWVFLGKIRYDNRGGILAVFSGGTSGLF